MHGLPKSKFDFNATTRLPASRQMPLGTADWLSNSSLRHYQTGDLWLGRTQENVAVGLHDDRHVLVCFGSRSGKGTSFIIPNLCMWRGSTVVVDPKGENAIVTARSRANGSAWSHGMGQKVHILDPFDAVRTPEDDFADLKASFNPLDALREDDPESVEMSYRLADGMVSSEKSSSDPFWEDAPKEFISSVMLHVSSSPEIAECDRTLLTVRRLILAGDAEAARLSALADPERPVSGMAALFQAMQRNPAYNGLVASAGAALADLEAKSPRLFHSILSIARTNTRFIDGARIASVLGRSSFSLRDLKTDPKGVSVYFCLPDRAMESHFRWLRMMIALTTTEMERTAQQPASGSPVMMVLDEFPALRRMRTLENAAAQIAGYGVKLVFITQTLGQLKDNYKDNWGTFVANAGVRMFSCNADHFTRDYVCKLVGDTEVTRFQYSESETIGSSSSFTHGGSASISSGSSYSAGGQGNGTWGWNSGRSETSSFSRTFGTNHSVTRGISTAVHKRPLLTPDEIGRVFGDRDNPKALVLISGCQPVNLNRPPYFHEPLLKRRYGWHPSHPKPMSLKQWQDFDQFNRDMAKQMAEARAENARRDRIEATHAWRRGIIRDVRTKKLERRGKQVEAAFISFCLLCAVFVCYFGSP